MSAIEEYRSTNSDDLRNNDQHVMRKPRTIQQQHEIKGEVKNNNYTVLEETQVQMVQQRKRTRTQR